jgi:hypothetical protein
MHPRLTRGLAISAAVFALAGAACTAPRKAASAGRVVVITPKDDLAPGPYAGAEDFVRERAKKGDPGEVHAILPDGIAPGDKRKGGAETAMADFVAKAAADPAVKAIVVDPALPGCAEGFRRAKAARPELVCVAGDSREDQLALESSADLVVDLDRVYRAYLVPWAAKKMGAKSLVAVYSAAEGLDQLAAGYAAREQAIMSAAAGDFGIKYVSIETPPGTDAAAFARAMTGSWLKDNGPGAALYCSDPAIATSLLAGAIAGNGYLVDAAAAATSPAYAAVLGLDLSPAKGEARKERSIVEREVSRLGLKGRLGLWDADYERASVTGMAEFAQRAAAANGASDPRTQLLAALSAAAPGGAWIAAYDIDPSTGVKSANHVLLREDVYVLGSGYLQSALQQVPVKYLVAGSGSR